MCGRFFIDPDDTPEALAEILAILEEQARRKDPSYRIKRGEICPADEAAVLALNRRLAPAKFLMRWGYHLDKRLVFNARAESAAEKPLFRDSAARRRCLIPASAYYEWDHREARPVKYRFSVSGQPMMYLAGLYRFEPSSDCPVFTILTRPAAERVACFHPRMPVILPEEGVARWLDPSRSFADACAGLIDDLVWKSA